MNSFDPDELAADWKSLGSPATDLVERVHRHERAMRRSPVFDLSPVGSLRDDRALLEQFREAETADLA